MLGPHDLEEFYETKDEAGQRKAAPSQRLKLVVPLRMLVVRPVAALRRDEVVRAA